MSVGKPCNSYLIYEEYYRGEDRYCEQLISLTSMVFGAVHFLSFFFTDNPVLPFSAQQSMLSFLNIYKERKRKTEMPSDVADRGAAWILESREMDVYLPQLGQLATLFYNTDIDFKISKIFLIF